ncbi:MAG TPA: MlaD family protein [Acidimicrobiales bacterium]|jgi:virulence factor Mce-like protein|nr:MlaD family protein [Acidimicrobiales bacterium]
MISRRLVINLVAFFLVSFLLVGYGVVNLLGNPLQNQTVLTTEFPDASGLYPNFTVELNGVPVGTVASTKLTRSGTKVIMDINPGTTVPSDVKASVQIANDLGEQVVNLVPTRAGRASSLHTGDNVPAAKDQVPADVGAVVASATKFLEAIPPGDLNKVITDLAVSLKGRAGDLRTIISAGTTYSKEFVAYEQQFTELLANAPPALNAVTAVGPALQQDLANTAALVKVLADQKDGLHTLLVEGSNAFGQVDNLVTTQSANLGCVLHDVAAVVGNIAQPTNLTNLSQGLAYNQDFFGAVNQIAVAGAAKATTDGQPAIQNQVFLRTRLIIPPILAPAASTYTTANQLPDTLPGAACTTVYGNGVGAGTQAGFQVADGGKVVAPTTQDADVELNGLPPLSSSSAAYKAPARSDWSLVVLGGVLVPVLFLAWGARPSRRRTRRRAS